MEQVVIACKHLTKHRIQPLPGQPITTVSCYRCYLPKHERTPAYYRVRTVMRALFWTVLVSTISGLSILGIWVLWAVL